MLRYFTPDYVQSEAHLTMTSFGNNDSSLCLCGNVENTDHYFLRCQFYGAQRAELINKISQHTAVTLHILLFGNPLPFCPQIHPFVKQFTNILLTRSVSNYNP